MCDALKGAMTKIKMQGLTGGKDGLTWNESGAQGRVTCG